MNINSPETIDAEESRRFVEETLAELDTYEERLDAFNSWSMGHPQDAYTMAPLTYITQAEFFDDA